MKKLLEYIEKYALRPMEKISQQRHLLAIRNGVMAAFPLTLIASLFMFIAVLPIPESWALKQFIIVNQNIFLAPYRMTVFVVTLYVVIGVGSNLAEHYGYDPLSGSLISIVAFLMTIIPINVFSIIPAEFLYQAQNLGLDTSWASEIKILGWVLPENPLGESGILVGILSAIFGVEVMNFSKKMNMFKKTQDKAAKTLIPPAVTRSLETIMPIFIVTFTLFIVRDVLGINLQGYIMDLMNNVINIATTLPGAIALVVMVTLLWTFGIRGFAVASTAASPLWIRLIQENIYAYNNNLPIPNVAPQPFYQWFVWIGGTGGTLSLVIILCFSKTRYLKKLGLTSLLPSLININEPVIYGVPLILNPYMSIPFIIGPTLSTVVAYTAMNLNLVTKPFAAPPANFPAPVGAYLATGGDWRAVILCAVNMLICGIVYYPFVKAYEQKIISDGEKNAEKLMLKKDKPPKVTSVD